METIVALYDDFMATQRAIKELVANGFDRSNINLVVNDVTGEYGLSNEVERDVEARIQKVVLRRLS